MTFNSFYRNDIFPIYIAKYHISQFINNLHFKLLYPKCKQWFFSVISDDRISDNSCPLVVQRQHDI